MEEVDQIAWIDRYRVKVVVGLGSNWMFVFGLEGVKYDAFCIFPRDEWCKQSKIWLRMDGWERCKMG